MILDNLHTHNSEPTEEDLLSMPSYVEQLTILTNIINGNNLSEEFKSTSFDILISIFLSIIAQMVTSMI